MPPLAIKRKDSLVKAVRRNATALLDAAIEALTGRSPSEAELAYRDLLRLQSLLHLVRQPLGREVFNREHRIVARSLSALSPPRVTAAETLRHIAAAKPVISADGILEKIADEADPAPIQRHKTKTGPDPERLRLVADLAEVRMRARYWHLPDGGFELLAPGLRRSYQQAARSATAETPLDENAAALRRLADHCQAFEKAWPELFLATRKALLVAEKRVGQQVELATARPFITDHPELLARTDKHIATHREAVTKLQTQLFAESPAAFAKRIGVIWEAWRKS
ncbi:MAG: hypothetical protein AAGH99_03980 [Planctomycetota bacterium]